MTSIREAVLSPCGTHRYQLSRTWDRSLDVLGWIMLNPSTADASIDDPTIRRCVGFAKDLGYGAILVGNLFSLRATDPKALLRATCLNGPDSDFWIDEVTRRSKVVIAGWGQWGERFPGRVGQVFGIAQRRRTLHALGVTKAGHPRHPLYLPRSSKLAVWP